jgi:VanZ family protein
LFYWLPPLLWMGAIFWFSTDEFSADNTGSLLQALLRYFLPEITEAQINLAHFLVRKTGHFTVYAVLALLLMRAFRAGSKMHWRWQWACSSCLIVTLYALFDEYHQAFTSTRTASLYDSFIDMAGGYATIGALWLKRLRREP